MMQAPNGRSGYLRMPVLQELIGKHYDEKIMMLVSTLRPSSIKIESAHLVRSRDMDLWEVEIAVGPGQRVTGIWQLVEIKLCGNLENSQALSIWLMDRCRLYAEPTVIDLGVPLSTVLVGTGEP